jgi:endonuclease YncB( thermonuclease family)
MELRGVLWNLVVGLPLLLNLTACAPASAQPTVSGLGRAKDGDSLMVGHTEVRLFGIDAPEFDQSCTKNGQPWACGSAAADQLLRLVTGGPYFFLQARVTSILA